MRVLNPCLGSRRLALSGVCWSSLGRKRPSLKSPQRKGAAFLLTLAESGINGVMSWFLISALLSRDNAEEEIHVCDPHADPKQARDGNSYDQQLNIVQE